MRKQLDIRDGITILLSFVSLLIPFYFFIVTSPEEIKSQTYIIFIGILIILIISIFVIYVYSKWMNLIKDTKSNKVQLREMERNLNLKDQFNKIDKRLTILEMLPNQKKGKKAQIDPRIIIWIVLIILLILFFKSIGVF